MNALKTSTDFFFSIPKNTALYLLQKTNVTKAQNNVTEYNLFLQANR